MSAQPARTRLRLLAAGLLALTALALTGCEDGQGVRDEGPAAVGRPAGRPGGPDGHAVPLERGSNERPGSGPPRWPSR